MIADTLPLAAGQRSADGLRSARLLAKRLLGGCMSPSEQEIAGAARSYLQLLQAGDEQASAASLELRRWHQSPHCAPYFLELLQARAGRGDRKKSGSYYTPWPVAQWIVRRTEQLAPPGPLLIVDPACGGGVFLLAAAALLEQRPGSQLIGYDTSAAAVALTEELLRSASAPATLRQINPLDAGEQLQSELITSDRTLVIVGNPPYANFGRRNRGPWIDHLVADYREGLDERKLNLTDDFIKFLRWGQHWVDRTGRGVLAMITSRTYLSGLTHRGMRRSLARSFPHIDIVDLHGDGEPGDANIFDIRRGVAIGVFGKQVGSTASGIQYHSIHGSRTKKLKSLSHPLPDASRWSPQGPDWMFVPARRPAQQSAGDYLSWPRLDQIFSEFISGVQTKHDRLFVDFDRDALAARMQQHLAQQGEPFNPGCLRPYVVGPFDRRWIYYDPRLLGRARWSVMRHMVQVEGNLALVFMRQSTSSTTYDHALVVDTLASDRVFYSRRGAPFLAPLWRLSDPGDRSPNFASAWSERMQESAGRECDPQLLLGYVYAVLHSHAYRQNHLAELQREFPRVPFPRSSEVFFRLSAIGQRLIACHTTVDSGTTASLDMIGNGEPTVARGYPRLNKDVLQLNAQCGLQLADRNVATFQVGGYPVLSRWLQVRRGRPLSAADMVHLAWIHDVAVNTRQLTREIDAILEQSTG